MTWTVASTLLFPTSGEGQTQLLQLTLVDAYAVPNARLDADIAGKSYSWELGPVSEGTSIKRVQVESLVEDTLGQFTLSLDGEETRREAHLAAHRQWVVYGMQHTHTDIGYTHIQPEVAKLHADYIDAALDYCIQTDGLPDDAKFRWVLEVSWQLVNYMAQRAADGLSVVKSRLDELWERIRQGRIELTALYGNMTELSSYDEICRYMKVSATLAKRHGLPLEVAVNSDSPGFGWALPDILTDAGIRYFTSAVNATRGARPATGPIFWWEGCGGGRVLVWNAPTYAQGAELGLSLDIEAIEERLCPHLQQLEARAYPYSLLGVRSGDSDNQPPNINTSAVAARWNSLYAYPRLVVSTCANFMKALEREAGSTAAVYKAGWPDWWSDGLGSAAYETGMVRAAKNTANGVERLLSMLEMAGVDVDSHKWWQTDAAIQKALDFEEHTWGSYATDVEPRSNDVRCQWSIKSSHAYAAEVLADKAMYSTMAALAGNMGHTGHDDEDASDIVVYNSQSWRRTDIVTTIIPLTAWNALGASGKPNLIDVVTGCSVPYETSPTQQRYREIKDVWAGKDPASIALSFLASDVPALGTKVFSLTVASVGSECASECMGGDTDESARKSSFEAAGECDECTIANDHFRVKADPTRGGVTSIIDLSSGRELVDAGAEYLLGQLIYELFPEGRSWGNPTGTTPKHTALSGMSMSGSIKVGPLSSFIELTGTLTELGKVRTRYTLHAGLRRIDVEVELDKPLKAKAEAAYIAFPFALPEAELSYETCGGAMKPGVDQLPATATDWYALQSWVNLRTPDYAIAWASFEAPLVHLGAINTGRWLKQPEPVSRPSIFSYIFNTYWPTNFMTEQSGMMRFRYSISAGPTTTSSIVAGPTPASPIDTGTIDTGSIAAGRSESLPQRPEAEAAPDPIVTAHQLGWGLQNPLVSIYSENAGSTRKLRIPLVNITISPANVVAIALKPAWDGRGYILRLLEVAGKDTQCTVTLALALALAGSKLSVLRASTIEDDIENEVVPLSATTDGYSFECNIKSHGVYSMRIIQQKGYHEE